MKRTASERLKMAKEYFADHTSITLLCKKYKTDKSNVQYSICLYERFGEEPFTDEQSNRVHTREEKLCAIKNKHRYIWNGFLIFVS